MSYSKPLTEIDSFTQSAPLTTKRPLNSTLKDDLSLLENSEQILEVSVHQTEVYHDEKSVQSFQNKRQQFQKFQSDTLERESNSNSYGTFPKRVPKEDKDSNLKSWKAVSKLWNPTDRVAFSMEVSSSLAAPKSGLTEDGSNRLSSGSSQQTLEESRNLSH